MPLQPLSRPPGPPWACLLVLVAMVIAARGAATDSEISPDSVIQGEVIEILDGDSLTLQVAGSEVRVRLAQIDAPEKGQPYGSESKAALIRLAAGRSARVTVVDIDQYGRTVGELYVGNRHINAEMVRRGHAWAYTRYARTVEIIDLEDEARKAKRGLWALPESQRDAPWVWRHRQRQTAPNPEDRRCGAKRTCSEMASCAEARFHFGTCGLAQLDGDGDGVPCERLCRSR